MSDPGAETIAGAQASLTENALVCYRPSCALT